MRARRAQLWVRVGMELEIGWETPILDGCRNPKIREGASGHLDASSNVVRLGVPTQRVTRAMGDVHPSGNPHYWLDPLNGRIVAQTVCDRLCELAPAKAKVFRANLASFMAKLDQRMFGGELVAQVGGNRLWALLLDGGLDADLAARGLSGKVGGWYGALLPHRGKQIVTYHRSWNYFTSRFGIRIAAELEPKPGIPPSAPHLASVMRTVKTQRVKVLLIEPFYSRRSADLVARKTGAKVIVCANSVGGQAGAKDYLSMLDQIVKHLAEEL
jgi:zinc/manganese transport system substrate-binding protein